MLSVALNRTLTGVCRSFTTLTPADMELNQVAVPAVYALISFLGYPSQILLSYLDPGPLTKNELILSNTALVLIYITYTKSVFVDPGRIPKGWEKKDGEEPRKMNGNGEKKGGQSRKWCRKCDAPKPPRTHHCKECKRQAVFILSINDPSHSHLVSFVAYF